MPDNGQMHLVMFSIKFSVMQRSVRHVGSKVAFASYLFGKGEENENADT